MISDQSQQSSEVNAQYAELDLTVEESFFIELLQKKEKQTIDLKFTAKGVQMGNMEPFTNYYSEAEIKRLLESLVSKKAITRQEKGAVLLCPKCGGYANMPVLVCPRCGSTKISRKEDLFHPECEYWGPTEEFIDGVLLRCPRCDELLDEKALEGTPGYFSISDPYFECHDCGTAVSKNNITMVCIKCKNKYTTVQAAYLNSVSYILASGVPVKPHAHPPKKITEKIEEKEQPPVEEANPEENAEPKQTEAEEKQIESPEETEIMSLKKAEQKQVKKEEKFEPIEENIPKPQLDEPLEKQPETQIQEETAEKEIEEQTEPQAEKASEVELDEKPVEKPEPIHEEPEQEPIVEPVVESEDVPEEILEEKSGPEILQNSIKRVSDLFRKTTEKKTSRKKKTEPEPEFDEEEYEEEEYEEEEEEEEPRSSEAKTFQILMIVENVTVSEFIIESLEKVKKPINVIHVDEGNLALKELRHIYDALILDLDLKEIDSKLILSEMEKWSIMTPIIALSDHNQRLDKYILNVETVLKKKQGDIHKLRKILQKLL